VVDVQTEAVERPNAGFISMRQLLKPPPGKARKAYEQAVRSDAKGQLEAAVSGYRRAIGLFPDYADAHLGLAGALEKLNRPSEAVAEWETARRLGVESPELYSGLSLSLLQLGRRAEAEAAARQALSMDPSSASAHYLLACSLVLQAKARVEALAHLARAAGRVPKAWLMSARLRAQDGDVEGARRELGEYLKVCAAGERPSAERWLSELPPHHSFVEASR
jgi:tetratricopeptide (TPR) repeat protein